ncbi:MAG: class II glutamine amidotransferase [Nitrososphaerales archaeon]
MCRMLAIISMKPLSTHYLRGFRRLSEDGRVSRNAKTPGHKDGWGVVRIDRQPAYLGHKALQNDGAVEANAATSQDYGRVCVDIEEKRLNGIFLAHLRKASSGKRVLENTAPFIEGKWSFTHNGTVYELGSGGVSDSRVLFKTLVEKMIERGDAVEGIRTALNKIKAYHTYSSMTFLLSDGRSLYAYRDYTQDGEYYSLKHASAEDSTLIFSQEEIWSLNWTTIPNRSLVIADRYLKIKGPFKI